jgi:Icc-related predicted phosphoesterase
MRIRVVSDVHADAERLLAAGRDCDVLVVLGDLLNVIDYRSMDGILVDIYGREPVAAAAELRAQGRFAEARETLRREGGDEGERRMRFLELARAQYEEVLAALPPGAVVTYGNVDVPDLLRAMLPTHACFVDGAVVELGGMRWGLVGGGVRTPLGLPSEVDDAGWDAKLDALGDVDVVGTHMPPRIPWLCYDLVARKFEPGSTPLLRFIRERQPRHALFGHVHNPMASRLEIGGTQLINVGHFRGNGGGWVLDTPATN